MKLRCGDCGQIFDEEEAVLRFAEHGSVMVPTCPACKSEELFDAEGPCSDCAWLCWSSFKEIGYCGCPASEWHGEEVGSDMTCSEWEEGI